MLEAGRILVPLDGSPLSERSLPYAISLARALHGRLVLMIAAYLSEIPEDGPWSDEMVAHPHETCTAYLQSVKQRTSHADTELLVKVGYPHEAILEAAREVDASLIVASTHGRSGLSRWVYGSTARDLLHDVHIPLLAIGRNVPDRDGSGFSPAHVLVPLDGSALGEASLPYALELTRAFGAKVSLVRVAPCSVEAYPLMVPQMYWPDLDKELLVGATDYLQGIRGTLEASVAARALQGPRAETLLGFVEQEGVDLVVMTTRARAGVQRAFLGSTADRMLDGLAPVLLIRPDESSKST